MRRASSRVRAGRGNKRDESLIHEPARGFVVIGGVLGGILSVLDGHPMLVCSRCAGGYAGLMLGALIPMPRRFAVRPREALGGAAALMLTEIVAQDLGMHPVWHSTRFATGMLLGWVAAALFLAR